MHSAFLVLLLSTGASGPQAVVTDALAPLILARHEAPPQDPDRDKEYERRREAAGKDVEALWDLHIWCSSFGMSKQSRSCLRAILKSDSDHRPAHEASGHLFFDGKWFTTQKKLDKYKKAEGERIAKEKGLVRFEDEWVPEAPRPAEPQPSLEEYRRKWDDLKARHERAIPGDFSPENLCPRPISQLWQDCPCPRASVRSSLFFPLCRTVAI